MIKKIINIRKTCFVREGGRNFRYTVFSLISNGKKKIGLGYYKSKDLNDTIFKSIKKAKEDLSNIKKKIINKIIKIGKTKIYFKSNNSGINAGGNIRKVIKATNIKNITCKIYGSKNKTNTIKVIIKFFKYLKK